MRRSNFLFLFLFFGCENNNFTSAIYNKGEKTSSVVRDLASDKKVRCFEKRFQETLLQLEVEEIEREYPQNNMESEYWKGVDLSRLTLPEVNFLKRFGDKIGDLKEKDQDFSSCSNLVCIINQIYENKIPEAGYVHYLWYLKTNQLLSFDNLVPKQKSKLPGEFNGRKFLLEDYLFSKDELKDFWTLTHLMTGPFQQAELMKEIQRIPKGESFEEDSYKSYCGLASPAGWIKLSDQCLVNDQKGRASLSYLSIMHEISHQLDFFYGRNEFNSPYRSHLPDYLEVSGFKLDEYIDESGYVFREWRTKEEGQYLNYYSKTNPQENFSEVSAYYFLNGEKLRKEVSEDQYNFMKEKIFKGKEFLNNYLKTNWVKNREKSIFELILKIPRECFQNEPCRERELEGISKMMFEEVQFYEPHSCDEFQNDEFKASFIALLNSKTHEIDNKVFIENDDENSSQQFEIFDRSFPEKVGLIAYLNCYSKERDCYQASVRESLGENLEEIYLSLYPWEAMEKFVESKMRIFISSNETLVNGQVQKIWALCSLNGIPYSGGEVDFRFVPSGFIKIDVIRCINQNYKSLVEMISNQIGGIEHKSERIIIENEISKIVFIQLEKLYEEAKNNEWKEITVGSFCGANAKENLKFHTPEDVISSGVECEKN